MPEWWGQASAHGEPEVEWLEEGVVVAVESMPEWWGQASAQRETGWLGVGGRSRVGRGGRHLGIKSAVEGGVLLEQQLLELSLTSKTRARARDVFGRGGISGPGDLRTLAEVGDDVTFF